MVASLELDSNRTVARRLHSEKQEGPMIVTDAGMEIERRDFQAEKVEAGNSGIAQGH
jgi:hypothetical protein